MGEQDFDFVVVHAADLVAADNDNCSDKCCGFSIKCHLLGNRGAF
jgi:hypothetical protein